MKVLRWHCHSYHSNRYIWKFYLSVYLEGKCPAGCHKSRLVSALSAQGHACKWDSPGLMGNARARLVQLCGREMALLSVAPMYVWVFPGNWFLRCCRAVMGSTLNLITFCELWDTPAQKYTYAGLEKKSDLTTHACVQHCRYTLSGPYPDHRLKRNWMCGRFVGETTDSLSWESLGIPTNVYDCGYTNLFKDIWPAWKSRRLFHQQ